MSELTRTKDALRACKAECDRQRVRADYYEAMMHEAREQVRKLEEVIEPRTGGVDDR